MDWEVIEKQIETATTDEKVEMILEIIVALGKSVDKAAEDLKNNAMLKSFGITLGL